MRWRFEGTEGLALGEIGWPGWPARVPSTIDYTTVRDDGAWHRPRGPETWFPDAFAGTMGGLLHALETGMHAGYLGPGQPQDHRPLRGGPGRGAWARASREWANSTGRPTLILFAPPRLTILLFSALPWPGDATGPFVAGAVALAVALAALATVRIWRWRSRRVNRFSQLRAQATERRRAERALLQTEVFYHSLVETIPQMILCKDLEGRFTFANQKFCAELGTTLEAIKGKTDLDFFPKELAEKYRADDRRVIESGQVLDVVEQHVTPKGEKLYVQTMKTPLFGPDGEAIGIQGIFWDVTERMRAEEKLKEQNVTLQELARSEHQAHEALKTAQSRMVETEKLASLGQLVAGVAHEINNPLAFVSNNIAVLERDLLDLVALVGLYRRARDANDEDRAALDVPIAELCEQLDLDYCLENLPRIIERTREGLRRIERIVKDLRLFARVDEGEWNEVDLNPGIESSVNMVQGYARKHGVTVGMDLGPLPADPLPRREAPSGRRQLADERHRRLPARGHGHDPHPNG